jgi:hypothetical protein
MGLLTNILLAPFLGPVWGSRWTIEQVDRVVREELTGPDAGRKCRSEAAT